MHKLSFVKKSKKSEISYLNDYAVFDTETSHVDDISWIYVWGFYFNGQYVQRRTPSDFVSLLNYYQKKYSDISVNSSSIPKRSLSFSGV